MYVMRTGLVLIKFPTLMRLDDGSNNIRYDNHGLRIVNFLGLK